jgi:hypothetical protein
VDLTCEGAADGGDRGKEDRVSTLRPRFIIACDVIRYMRWLQDDADKLIAALGDETLSEEYWQALNRIITDLEALSKRARPRLPMAAE